MRLFILILLFPILGQAEEPTVSIIGNSVVVECNGQEFKKSMNESTDALWDWIKEVCKLDQK